MTPGKKMTIFTDERQRAGRRVFFEAAIDELSRLGILNVTVVKGMAGIGRSRTVHTSARVVMSENLPVVIEASDTVDKIDSALQAVTKLGSNALIEVTAVELLDGNAGS